MRVDGGLKVRGEDGNKGKGQKGKGRQRKRMALNGKAPCQVFPCGLSVVGIASAWHHGKPGCPAFLIQSYRTLPSTENRVTTYFIRGKTLV